MEPQEMMFVFLVNVGCFVGFVAAMFFVLGILVKGGYFTYYEYDTTHTEPRMLNRILAARNRDGWVLVALYQDTEKGNQLAVQFKKKFTRLPWGQGVQRVTNN